LTITAKSQLLAPDSDGEWKNVTSAPAGYVQLSASAVNVPVPPGKHVAAASVVFQQFCPRTHAQSSTPAFAGSGSVGFGTGSWHAPSGQLPASGLHGVVLGIHQQPSEAWAMQST
jgi:hypothetical protein